jgi:hypothetical protein
MAKKPQSQILKSFFVKNAIYEAINLNKIQNPDFIYSIKIDLPDELQLIANKIFFQELILKLFKKTKTAYVNQAFVNKIILFTAQLENAQKLSLSITNGGQKLSFFDKLIKAPNIFLLRDRTSHLELKTINYLVKTKFSGKLEIINKTKCGFTLKCYLPITSIKR